MSQSPSMRAVAPPVPLRSGYVLIDPSNLDSETFASDLPMLPCVPPTMCSVDDMMPHLIDVVALTPEQQSMLGTALLRESACERPPVLCAWLDSTEDATTVARHIARFLVGPGANGHLLFWRYHDPRVMALTLSLFSPDQMEALLGPISDWRFAWCQRWWSATGPGRAVDPLNGYRPAWPSPGQWASLDHSELIGPVLWRLKERERMSDAQCLQCQRHIDRVLHHAKRELKISKHDDLTEYAFHGVRYGDAFHRHPKLVAAWPALAQAQLSWSDVRDLLDHNDYLALDEAVELRDFTRKAA
ncbi:MAG: DUF4123 domain-containing protein [Pseudomonadota bacterium]